LQGEFCTHILYFVFILLYFIFTCIVFYQKHTKISFLYSYFYLLAFSLARMSNPEVEVRTFKQQGGENLKDAWYRISNSHHRCMKKHSTMILLRNFYLVYLVGIGTFLILLQEVILFYLSLESYYYCNKISLSFLFRFCAKRNL
jgi:hypothetical protein